MGYRGPRGGLAVGGSPLRYAGVAATGGGREPVLKEKAIPMPKGRRLKRDRSMRSATGVLRLSCGEKWKMAAISECLGGRFGWSFAL